MRQNVNPALGGEGRRTREENRKKTATRRKREDRRRHMRGNEKETKVGIRKKGKQTEKDRNS